MIGLGDEARSALFYALLLQDAGCSSNASCLSSLFAADDQTTQAGDEAHGLVQARRARALHLAQRGPGRLAAGQGAQLRTITREEVVTHELIGTRRERGAGIARMLELPDAMADAIFALDEHWDGSRQPLGLKGAEIPLMGRILCLAQTVEVFSRTVGVRGAYAMALKRRGHWFDPALVDAMLGFRDDTAF